MMFISLHFVHHVRPVHHAHTERVHCGLASYLLNQVDQPATKLKSLIDSNTEFYVMSGSADYRWNSIRGH
jgi:hypothetical protein